MSAAIDSRPISVQNIPLPVYQQVAETTHDRMCCQESTF